MVRVLISLSDPKLKKIDALARKLKKSRAQVLREAVDLFLKKNADNQEGWKDVVDRAAGMWKHRAAEQSAGSFSGRAEWSKA